MNAPAALEDFEHLDATARKHAGTIIRRTASGALDMTGMSPDEDADSGST